MPKETAICKTCGVVFEYYTTKSNGVFCSRECMDNFDYPGGTWLGKNGYMYFQKGRASKELLHRKIARDAGLLTIDDETSVVHHKNGDRLDNRIENLEVLKGGQSEHIRLHNPVMYRWYEFSSTTCHVDDSSSPSSEPIQSP